MTTDTLSDRHVQYAVEAELRWTPDVEATHIGVSVDNHAVTLTGAVGSFPERMAARRAALRVMGVSAVADHPTLHFAGSAVTDSDIAESVGSLLERNAVLPHGTIQASVRVCPCGQHQGCTGPQCSPGSRQVGIDIDRDQVTLTGHLPSMSEKKQAALTAWSSPGVGTVISNIREHAN